MVLGSYQEKGEVRYSRPHCLPVKNRSEVVERNTLPARSTVEGKSGWEGLQGKCCGSSAKPLYLSIFWPFLPRVGQSYKKLPVYSWMPGWLVYSFMLMPVLSLLAQAARLWLEPRSRSST